MFNSVRTRLTVWYVLIFGALLMMFGGWLYWLLARNVHTSLDQMLANAVRTAVIGFESQMIENNHDPRIATAHTFTEFNPPGQYLAIWSEGKLLGAQYFDPPHASSASHLEKLVPPAAIIADALREPRPHLLTIDDVEVDGCRMAALATRVAGHDYVIVVAESRRETMAQLRSLRQVFFLVIPAMLLIAGLAGWLLARKSLGQIAVMTEQAELINARNLHERLPVNNPRDELGRLALVFNQLLSRLEHSFDGMREFTADASHELRTPLAIIRGEADVALGQERSVAEYKESLAIIQDEARHLTRLVDDMLALARADAGARQLKREELYLNDLLVDCCHAVRALASHQGVVLNLLPSQDVLYRGDQELLRRLILNLLDNAVKYTPRGGVVTVQLSQTDDVITLSVADTGIGIPAEAVGQVFERFYRVDKARSRAEGGSGLGLPIVKWVAEVHGGEVALTSEPSEGSTFTVTLPKTG